MPIDNRSAAERLQLWTFALAAADPRPDWSSTLWADVARASAAKPQIAFGVQEKTATF
jgi:hypothetical protein